MLAQNFFVSTWMLLLFLLCYLVLLIALSTISPITKRSTFDTLNNTIENATCDSYASQEQKICDTTYCDEIAETILQSMDGSVNPCDNFYNYACGSWKKHNPIPQYEEEWSVDHIITEKTYRRIIGLLAQREKSDEILPVRMARKFYRSCMNLGAIERLGVKPIIEILKITDGWPVMKPGKVKNDKLSWQETDKQYLPLMQSNAFYKISFEVDRNNTNQYVLTINQYPKFQTKKNSVEMNDERFLHIFRVIEALAKEENYILNHQQVDNDITKMLHFMNNLKKITGDDVKNQTSDNYERMTIEELQKWYDSSGVNTPTTKINFLDVIQSMFKIANISINASEPIIVYNPEFLHQLAQLLAHTSPRTLVNYVQWNFVKKFSTYTTEEIRGEGNSPRWVECLNDMKMKHAISYMFVRKYISDDSINKTNEIIDNLKAELWQQITRVNWISQTDKRSLKQKLNAIEFQIGYPDWYKNDQALIKYYEGLTISSDYFQNVLNCEKHEFLWTLRRFTEFIVKKEWSGYPVTVNAYSDQQKNVIFVPAAEFQDPYLTLLLPDAINYGNIGFIIGHELSHNFDNEGIQFDANGCETEWVSREMFEEYEERATCFVNQYNNYTLDIKGKQGALVKLDGRLTQSENIADSIGIQIAYSAYKKVSEKEPQMMLPGLQNVSNDELFFLMFANSWCSTMNEKHELNTVSTDEHSPPMHRVIGSLSNMAEFSKIFNCSKTSPMNPQNKCNIWN